MIIKEGTVGHSFSHKNCSVLAVVIRIRVTCQLLGLLYWAILSRVMGGFCAEGLVILRSPFNVIAEMQFCQI